MRRHARIAAVVLGALWILLSIAPAAAAEPTVMQTRACERAVPLAVGELAPCDGDQVPAPWLLELLTDRRQRRRLEQDLARAEERRRLELAAADAQRAADRQRLEQELTRAEERRRLELAAARQAFDVERAGRLEAERLQAPPPPPEPSPPPWWQRPAWIFLGGVLVGAGLSVAVVLATR